jgi:hypothetical protein
MSDTFRLMAAIALASTLVACSEKMDEATRPGPAASTPAASTPAAAPVPPGAQFQAAQETPDAIAAALTGGVCSVENVVTVPDETASPGERPNTYVATRDKGYRLVGFAVNKDRGTVPAEVELILSGVNSYRVPVQTGRPRGDVADYFKNPAFAKAGYMADVAFNQVQPGDYALFFAETEGGAKAYCATNQSITIN